MGPLTTRPAILLDAPSMARLAGVLGYPTAADVFAARLERWLARDDGAVFVAEIDGTMAGWLHVAEQDLLETERHAEILGLVVDASHRNAGVGRRLVDAAEAWTRARGLAELAVRSNVVRLESHPFYERVGFTRTKTQHRYRKPVGS